MRIIIGLLCLCFLIFFHELGHFLFAKLFKVKVESFSIGMGPILLHKKFGDTDYRLSLFPFGGYCGIKGEKDFQYAIENNLSSISGEKDSMYGTHPLKRALIGFAGPLFNFVFSIFALCIISMIGYSTYSYSNKILIPEETETFKSAAKEAGLLSGDKIIQINKTKIENFSDLIEIVTQNPDSVLNVKIERNSKILDFKVKTDFDKSTGTGKIGVSADTETLHEIKIEGKNFFISLKNGFLESVKLTKLTIKGIFTLFKGVDVKNAVSGPARVADMLGSVITESATDGAKTVILNLLNFLSIISISLFIMNLLPIPILDGGLILFALIEAIFHKKIHPKIYYYIQIAGFIIIAFIFIIGISGDFVYFKNLIRGTK